MAEIITMPKMSDTMTEGVVAEWLKKVGDVLKPGDGLLAEIETDKATMELDLDERLDLSNYKNCRLLYIGLEKGKPVPVDSIIAIIGEEGESYESLLSGSAPAAAVEAAPVAAAPNPKNFFLLIILSSISYDLFFSTFLEYTLKLLEYMNMQKSFRN